MSWLFYTFTSMMFTVAMLGHVYCSVEEHLGSRNPTRSLYAALTGWWMSRSRAGSCSFSRLWCHATSRSTLTVCLHTCQLAVIVPKSQQCICGAASLAITCPTWMRPGRGPTRRFWSQRSVNIFKQVCISCCSATCKSITVYVHPCLCLPTVVPTSRPSSAEWRST